jgi:hypothetical protein
MASAVGDEPLINAKDDLDIDKLTKGVDKLRLELAEFGCSTKGNKQTLQKRLKQAKKNSNSSVKNEVPTEKDINEKDQPSNDLVVEGSGYVSSSSSSIVRYV